MEWAGREGVCLIPFGGGTSVTRALEVPPLEVEPRPVISVDMRKVQYFFFFADSWGRFRFRSMVVLSAILDRKFRCVILLFVGEPTRCSSIWVGVKVQVGLSHDVDFRGSAGRSCSSLKRKYFLLVKVHRLGAGFVCYRVHSLARVLVLLSQPLRSSLDQWPESM